MTSVIPQRELRNDNAKVIARVEAGESFVVTRNGVPVAELIPIRTERPTYVSKADLAKFVGVGPAIDFASFREDIDAFIDPYL